MYVYLIQPAILRNLPNETSRIKIGMSRVYNLSRLKSYNNGTRFLCILESHDPLATEKKLITAFRRKYKLVAGNEYFEIDNEQNAIDLFISVVRNIPQKKEVELNNKEPIPKSEWMNRFAYKEQI